jgi:hypothetical protein
MTLQQILDGLLTAASIILPVAGLPVYGALAAALIPPLDKAIAKVTADLAQTNAWTPEEQAAFQARIDALKSDPAWVVTP